MFGTHGKDGKLRKPRAATGFSLFVKERYAEVKAGLPPGTKQQQVMKVTAHPPHPPPCVPHMPFASQVDFVSWIE